jgi:hypothetical protein
VAARDVLAKMAMAIDFMVMPLSRYIAGDFVTPSMMFAWEQGLPYTLLGPEGRRDIPKDTLFGGSDAPSRRAQFVPMMVDDLKQLPGLLADKLWDEGSLEHPTFHRVDPRSFQALITEAEQQSKRSAFMGILSKKIPTHLAASVFLPIAFEARFDMPCIFERVAGSGPAALRELETGHWSELAASAAATLTAALRDSIRLNLPMLVDA